MADWANYAGSQARRTERDDSDCLHGKTKIDPPGPGASDSIELASAAAKEWKLFKGETSEAAVKQVATSLFGHRLYKSLR